MTATAADQAVPGSGTSLDTGTAWRLHPRVAVRPEPFGALLYHFGTRRLSFLKDVGLVDLVSVLGDFTSIAAALDALDVDGPRRDGFVAALQRLADTDMLLPVDDDRAPTTDPTPAGASDLREAASPSGAGTGPQEDSP